MKYLRETTRRPAIITLALLFVFIGCDTTNQEGEESGIQYTKTETMDEVRKGMRLILIFDEQANAFVGTVENTTSENLSKVRIEVHLSNGIELGPTTPADLAAGASRDVQLTTSSTNFSTWSGHPEAGNGENGGEQHGNENGGG